MYGISAYSPVEHLVNGPTLEPLDLPEVLKALVAVAQDDETLVDTYISAARQRFEEQTGRQIMTATWEYWLDAFPCGPIELPRAPLQSVVSVKYIDSEDGDLLTLSSATYTVKTPGGPQGDRGWLERSYGESWPSTRCESGAVRIQYLAGYGNSYESVPELVKAVLYLFVTDFFCSRCAADDKPAPKRPMGIEGLVKSFALHWKRTVG